MERLLNFINKAQEEQVLDTLTDPAVVGELAADLADCVTTQFIPEAHNVGGGSIFRASALDSPAVLLAWAHFNKDTIIQQELTLRTRSYFLSGIVFETLVYYVLRQLGYQVDRQRVVNIEIASGFVISGHVDFVCTCPDTGQVFGVETKEWADGKHSQVLASGVQDTRYLTQIAIYRNALQIPFIFVGGNRDSRELVAYAPDDDILTIAFGEAVRKVLMVANCTRWEDILTMTAPPPPVAEIFKRKPTGRWLPCFSMKEAAHLFYELSYEKSPYSGGGYKWYVTDYKYPPGYEHLKPPMPTPPM